MLKTEQEIKQGQLKALHQLFRTLLGFRLQSRSYQLNDVFEAMEKHQVKTDLMRLLIAFDTHSTANITKYQTYKKINPLVWFFYFDLSEQPSITIDYFYRIFFEDKRLLQAEKGSSLRIRYGQPNQENRINEYGANRLHDTNSRRGLGMGNRERRKLGRIDRPRKLDR
ncbi:hypothetical protein AsAng_0038060 [Aureispira anguillae]|uniref:Uncharacterized protein n=1 Tax=Aureispira anguillae TaxID=2864201 RepID=A0A915YH53_9BACT|nr:hypothetical protein AsAng_0038060 [Aureispira anguillae]